MEKMHKDQSPSGKKPKDIQPITTENVQKVLDLIAPKILNKTSVYAVTMVPDQNNQFAVRIIVDNKLVQELNALKETVNSKLAELNITAQIDFSLSNRLELFAPQPVCIQHYDQKGSSGVFLSAKKRIGFLSCAHALPAIGEGLCLAKLYDQHSEEAEVVATDQGIDLGLAVVTNKPSKFDPSVGMFKTSVAPPVDNEYVAQFGSASVEERGGFIRSHHCYAKVWNQYIGDYQTFKHLVNLAIDARHGDSGAPVVTNKNQVIGLIIGGDALNGEVFCSNLSATLTEFIKGADFGSFVDAPMFLHGTEVRQWSKECRNRRREIELQLHHGRIVRRAQKGQYGEIISDEGVSILTHIDNSFEASVQFECGQEVWFFAVPLEYVVAEVEMVGVSNNSPLLAINVCATRKRLEPMTGLYKLTPCGTGTTVTKPTS